MAEKSRVFYKMLRASLILLSVAFLSACSGTGTKSLSAIDIMISSEEKNKIFIKRSTGFQGSLLMMSVDVNGASAGEIGMNEILVAKIESGKNQVNISWGSIIKSVQIENTGEKNYFFNVMKKSNFGGLLILELTQESWRNLVD
jgi:hypothetical protein